MLRVALLGIVLANALPSCAQEKENDENGFVSLFDGKTLAGWTGEALEYFSIESGDLVCRKGCHGKLLTEREYGDFVFCFDFKLTPGANNGLAIRSPKEGDSAYVGIELQILDDTAEMYKDLKDYQFHGSAYGVAAAKRGALKPVGEWNSQEVRFQGRRLKVILNDQVILDTDLDEAAPNNKTIDGAEHPGLLRKQGHIGFLCHDDPVHFRNIQIKELSAESSE